MTLGGCSKKMCPMQVGRTDGCRLTKEQCPYFTQDENYQKIKTKVAMEIFAEIEKLAIIGNFTGNLKIMGCDYYELKNKYIMGGVGE